MEQPLTLSTIVAAVASLGGIVWGVIRASIRLGAVETKVDTMWAFQMRRAFSEVVQGGLGKLGSPLEFNSAVSEALAPIRSQLLAFWKTLPKGINDSDALLRIEAAFGDVLLTSVCIPCNLSHGACLLLALTIAKGSNEVKLAPTIPPIVIVEDILKTIK